MRATGEVPRDGPTREATLSARRPAAVLFDMDGTLVDSEKVWDVALAELARQAGGELSMPARVAMIGSGMAQSMQILQDDLAQPWRDAAADAAWLTDRVHQLFGGGLIWRPGAKELLAVVRSAGLPTALVTSTGRRLVEVALETLGRQSFDVVVCGDEVTAAKPDPTPYRVAAELLGVAIEHCVAIEDSPTGVASAQAAGAAVLAVPCELDLPALPGVVQRDSLIGVDIAFLAALTAAVP